MGSTKVPRWKKDRWVVIQKFFADPEVQDRLKSYDKYSGTGIIPLNFYELLARHSVPSDCSDAVLYRVENPEASDEKIIELITTPLEYISHSYRKRGPALNETNRYDEERWKTQRKIEIYGTDRANEDTNVYIKISPFTIKSEVLSFIEDQWRNIEPLLQKQHHESDGLFDPALLKGRKRGLVDRGKQEQIDGDILRKKQEGMNSTQISEYTEETYGYKIEPSNIRKKISRKK